METIFNDIIRSEINEDYMRNPKIDYDKLKLYSLTEMLEIYSNFYIKMFGYDRENTCYKHYESTPGYGNDLCKCIDEDWLGNQIRKLINDDFDTKWNNDPKFDEYKKLLENLKESYNVKDNIKHDKMLEIMNKNNFEIVTKDYESRNFGKFIYFRERLIDEFWFKHGPSSLWKLSAKEAFFDSAIPLIVY
jgi:hypothetical protein